MKRHRALFALTLLAFVAGAVRHEAAWGDTVSRADQSLAQAAPSEWREFSSRPGGFSVLMPGTPKEDTEVKEFPVVGKAATHLFVLTTESGVYVAAYLDVPGLASQTQAFCDSFGKGFLKTIGESTAKGAGGKVIRETEISFGKDPGKEILLELTAGPATTRAYFIRRRGYQLIAAPAAGSDPGNVKKFFDSFKVTAR